MRFVPQPWAVVGLSLLLHAIIPAVAGVTDLHDPTIEKVVTTIYIVEYPFHIRTNVRVNTSFVVDNDLSITVGNAPTNLSLNTIGTSRRTIVNTIAA